MTAYEASAEGQFDIDEALNTAGFAEFLACFPDAERMIDKSDIKGIERIYCAFENKKETVRGLKDVCKDEIYRDIAIKPEEADLAGIDAYIDAEFKRDPDAALKMLEDLSKTIQEFGASQDRIAAKEEELEELGGWSKLKEVKKDLKSAEGVMGFWKGARRFVKVEFVSKKDADAKKRIAEEFGITKLGDVKAKLSTITDAEQATKEFDKMRKVFFTAFAPMKDIADGMKTKAQDKLKAMFDHTAPMPTDLGTVDLAKLEEAQRYFKQLEEGPEAGHIKPAGDKYLEGIDPVQFQFDLDTVILAKIDKEIQDAVVGHSLGSGAFSRLEKTLVAFIAKQEIGSFKGSDAKYFVKSRLEAAINNHATPPANKLLAKRIMVKCLK